MQIHKERLVASSCHTCFQFKALLALRGLSVRFHRLKNKGSKRGYFPISVVVGGGMNKILVDQLTVHVLTKVTFSP